MTTEHNTHFGFKTVAESEKAKKVADVFHSVANKYDLMNDVMSAGLHRSWKRFAVSISGVDRGDKVLDIAGGSGDLSKLFAQKVGAEGQVILTDINASMLGVGRDRMMDAGLNVPALQCDAEKLPFPDNYFDCVIVAFGLRNMTHKDRALAEMQRVLKVGGRLLVLERSVAVLVLSVTDASVLQTGLPFDRFDFLLTTPTPFDKQSAVLAMILPACTGPVLPVADWQVDELQAVANKKA